MTGNILKLLLIEIIFNEVFGSQVGYTPHRQKYIQVPSQQYYQLSGAASTGSTHSYASPSAAYQSIITPALIDYSSYTKPRPYSTAVERTTTYDTPGAMPEPPPVLPQSTANVKPLPPLTSPPFDTNVLNNLAIALQLLIVSNLLNMPPPEQSEKSTLIAQKLKTDEPVLSANPISAYCESASRLHTYPSASVSSTPQAQEYHAYFESNLNDQPVSSQCPPNAKFLGADNIFGGLLGSLGVPPAKARPGLNLKSPYDAIASAPDNTPPSPFDYRKPDFQSPYAAIAAADNYKDLFSIDFY